MNDPVDLVWYEGSANLMLEIDSHIQFRISTNGDLDVINAHVLPLIQKESSMKVPAILGQVERNQIQDVLIAALFRHLHERINTKLKDQGIEPLVPTPHDNKHS